MRKSEASESEESLGNHSHHFVPYIFPPTNSLHVRPKSDAG